jgi:transposase
MRDYTLNQKLEQVTEKTLVLGVDIGSESHHVRAFNYRGIEYSRKDFQFSNDASGFEAFQGWMQSYVQMFGKTKVIVGFEPTGHYWFSFGRYVKQMGMMLVLVNPYHVKQIKELDDNSPKKTDFKDPKTIAKLVVDGRYSIPYIPEGVYAELRQAVSSRDRIIKEQNALTNRIKRWLKIYFPEYLKVYTKFSAESGLLLLEKAPLPAEIVELGVDGVTQIWREQKLRAVGKKRAETLVEAAKNSVGIEGGACAKLELQMPASGTGFPSH